MIREYIIRGYVVESTPICIHCYPKYNKYPNNDEPIYACDEYQSICVDCGEVIVEGIIDTE